MTHLNLASACWLHRSTKTMALLSLELSSHIPSSHSGCIIPFCQRIENQVSQWFCFDISNWSPYSGSYSCAFCSLNSLQLWWLVGSFNLVGNLPAVVWYLPYDLNQCRQVLDFMHVQVQVRGQVLGALERRFHILLNRH